MADQLRTKALLDQLFQQVRGALWGLVTVLGMAVLYLASHIWFGHLEMQQAKDAEQDQKIAIYWAEHHKAIEKFRAEQEEYRAKQSQDLIESKKFEAKTLALMQELTAQVRELQRHKR